MHSAWSPWNVRGREGCRRPQGCCGRLTIVIVIKKVSVPSQGNGCKLTKRLDGETGSEVHVSCPSKTEYACETDGGGVNRLVI